MAKDNTSIYYRQCFETDAGRQTLANILDEAQFFRYTETPEEQAVENFVKTILTKCGFFQFNRDGIMTNAEGYVTGLFNLKH